MPSATSYQASGFVLNPYELRGMPRCELVCDGESSELLVFIAPDRIFGLAQAKNAEHTVRVLGLSRENFRHRQVLASQALISIDDEEFFIPAMHVLNEAPLQAIVVWLRIPLVAAFARIRQLANIESDSEADAIGGHGMIANLLRTTTSAAGMFSLAALQSDPRFALPFLRQADDLLAPFASIAQIAAAENDVPPLRRLLAEERLFVPDLVERFEQTIACGQYTEAAELFHKYEPLWQKDLLAQFAAGRLFLDIGDIMRASEHFHQAQVLDHPLALYEHWACQRRLAAPFKKKHSALLQGFKTGKIPPAREVDAAVNEFPESAPAILSYSCLGAGAPERGLMMCTKALNFNRNQSDVLSNQWRFQLSLKLEQDGLETAVEHGRRFPQEVVTARNIVDSLLFTGQAAAAKLHVERYAILSTNLGLVAKQLFRAYEHIGDWEGLLTRFDAIMACIPRPGAATLTLYGEVLIENGDFDRCAEVFERALTLEPGNGKVILGYARALAQSDKEVEAECLLATALADPLRVDRFDDRMFIMTLLAEIQRRTGRPEEALLSLAELEQADILAIARNAGPLPGLELAEVYLALDRTEDARRVVSRLAEEFHDDPFVAEMLDISAGV